MPSVPSPPASPSPRPDPALDPAVGPAARPVAGVPTPVALPPRARRDPRSTGRRQLTSAALRSVISAGGPQVVYQPQLSLSRLVVDGYEALARFPGTPLHDTEAWFARARELGVADELEAAAVARALARRADLPPGTTLAVNLSPGVLASPLVTAVLPADLTGIEIELTEHEWLPGAARLRRHLEGLRERGARLAIDDVGAAHSGLRRVMELAPDRIKLDRALVDGVSSSTAKAALIRAVVDFADHIGASVCAEGVETVADLEALAELDVGHAQGWVVGLPGAGFADAEPVAVAVAGDSLGAMLTSGREARPDVDGFLRRLTSVTSTAELAELVSGCAAALGADRLSIGVVSADGATLLPLSPGGTTIRLAACASTRACLEKRSVVPLYVEEDEDARAELTRLGFRAGLLVPVISRDRAIGVLQCYRVGGSPWSRRQVTSARTVAAMLGPVLDLLLT